MPYSHATYEEKPYNRCLDCVHIGKNCDGPDFLAMDIPRLCEWSRLRKDYLHSKDKKWTNAYIAEAANVSKKTADRFFAGNVDDLKFTTAASIIQVLVNGTWGQYPCAMAAMSEAEYVDNPAIVEQCKQLQAALDAANSNNQKEIDFLKRQIEFKEEQLRSKDKLLDERRDFLKLKDRWIAILSIALAVALFVIVAALVIDLMNADVGFFWLDRLSDVFGGVSHNALDAFQSTTDKLL